MSSQPLPALDIKTPPAPPNPMNQFADLLKLQSARQGLQQQQALAPLNQQIAQGDAQQSQNAAQSSQIDLQQKQQAVQDQQAFRSASADPSNKDKTLGQIADVLKDNGKISPSGWAAAKKSDIDSQAAMAKLQTNQLANMSAGHKATQQLYNNVMDMPDAQVAANWPQIVQQYNSIPGNQKMPLNPQQPMTKQQLQNFGPMISMNGAYLDQEAARRKAAGEAANHIYTDPTTKQQFYGAIDPGKGISNPATGQLVPNATLSANPTGSQSLFSAWKAEHPKGTVEQFIAEQNSSRPEFPRIVPVNDGKGNVVGYNTFTGTGGGVRGQYIGNSSIAGLPQNLGETPGLIPPKPTAAVLTQSQRSAMIQPQVQALNSQIDDTVKYLGPLAGRWSGVMTGKVGANSPAVAKLQTQLKLYTTALMLAHGLRGEQYEKSLAEYFNTAQSAGNLKARIEGANGYLEDYAASTGHGPSAAPGSPAATTPGSASTNPGSAAGGALPAVGAVKTFANGKTGKWDGHGWVAQ